MKEKLIFLFFAAIISVIGYTNIRKNIAEYSYHESLVQVEEIEEVMPIVVESKEVDEYYNIKASFILSVVIVLVGCLLALYIEHRTYIKELEAYLVNADRYITLVEIERKRLRDKPIIKAKSQIE